MATPAPAKMEHIDPESLGDLSSRINYLRKFIGFTADDSKVLRAAAPVVSPLVPAVVEAVYDKLLSFDITAQAFVPRQTGYGDVVPTSLQDLSQDHPMIRFRKDFLAGYLAKLVSLDFESLSSWQYLDKVGIMHTGQTGFAHRAKKPALRVEYMHCAILLGFVEDILVDAVMGHPALDLPTKTAVARAANKLLWIQNDLFARHYIADAQVDAAKEGSIVVRRSVAVTIALGLVAFGAALTHFSLPLFSF